MGKAVKREDPKADAAKAAAKKEKADADLIKACENDELGRARKGAACAATCPIVLFPHACDVLAAVDAGAELDFDVTGTGSTPMHIAAGYGSYEVCKLLHSVGAALDVICLGHFAPAWLVFPLSIPIVALGLACEPIQIVNDKKMTPLDVATQVGEDKIVRLLQALMRGEAPPVEVSDDDEEEDEAESAGAEDLAGEKPIAPPQEAVPAPQEVAIPYPVSESVGSAADVTEAAAAMSKLCVLSFNMEGRMGISMDKNVVAKVGEPGTQGFDHGRPGGGPVAEQRTIDFPRDIHHRMSRHGELPATDLSQHSRMPETHQR